MNNCQYIELTTKKAKAIEMFPELVEALQVADNTLTDIAKNGDSIAHIKVRDLIKNTLAKARN